MADGWWVLALGGAYDPDDFGAREVARVRLRQELLLLAIVPDEYVWVWDEIDRAQLVVWAFADAASAEAYAAYLSGRGVEVRVRRAFGEDV
ncbi:hypothetical protein K9F62_19265 [Desulfovibrio sp. JY]|nr:hypothetical protein K9F62_19265 [Desulfovibrio sp. JY]